jgi:hypothetical protein
VVPSFPKPRQMVCSRVCEEVQLDRCCGRGCASWLSWWVVATRLLHIREVVDDLTPRDWQPSRVRFPAHVSRGGRVRHRLAGGARLLYF